MKAYVAKDPEYVVLRHIPEIVQTALTVRDVYTAPSLAYTTWVGTFIDENN